MGINGGGKIKRRMLVAIFLAVIMTVGMNSAFAAEGDTSDSSKSPETTLPTDTGSSSGCSTYSDDSSKVKAESSTPMKAYWIWASDLPVNAADLKSKGITDVFILTKSVIGNKYNAKLRDAISSFHAAGINVHSWIACFKDNNQFRNPSGYYSYTNKIYVTTTKRWGLKAVHYYKKVKVGKYKVGKRWKYIYKYVSKYKYKKGWIYTPIHRYETVSGYDTSYNGWLTEYISDIANNYDVDGIHLDYVRYSGVASAGNAAWQQPGGTDAAVDVITNFVSAIKDKVDAAETAKGKTILLSAAVMPEMDQNRVLYAQDYSRLADYLDFFVPMIYEGNFKADNNWIASTTKFIVDRAKGKPVFAGLTTYLDDNHANIADPDIQADWYSAKGAGAQGFILFRYNGAGWTNIPVF